MDKDRPAEGIRDKSDRIISGIKNLRARERVVDVEEETVKMVIFSLFEDLYAFYGSEVKEILQPQKISYVPGAPDFFVGIINVRGDIESVINMNRFLGIPDSLNTQGSRILIAAHSDIRSGILVDSINDVLDLPVSRIKPPLATLNRSYREFILGEIIHRDRNITLLDIGKVFGKIAG